MEQLETKTKEENYNPSTKEQKILEFLKKRIGVLKESKKNILDGVNFEEIMKDADDEYKPKDIEEGTGTKMLVERENEITGIRGSKLETVKKEDDWRSKINEPTLLIKIQTAMSILIDNNPEAVFKAMSEKYEGRENIAKAIWKRNWLLNNGKNVLKLFMFDLMKYGWAVGRTAPRIIKRNKEILESIDTENPANNKYRKVEIIDFNDVYKEVLDPFRTWIDDKANLKDPYSINDWYFEKDFSKDDFKSEFEKYKNEKYIKYSTITPDDNSEDKKKIERDDMVTVGFYENKSKDLYCIIVPSQNILIYFSPLPNDEGKLTLWHTYWTIRDPKTIYGIGLWEIIKSNKQTYDRLKNMTVDQLVMAIYPMLFYSGANTGDMSLTISPSKIQQKLPSTTVDQIKIDFDPRGWDGVAHAKEGVDEGSGITPTLQGQVEGKTLGGVLHAKDAALKRLNIPMSNIANAIEQEAYLTLSWANQVYSVPEIKEFVSGMDLLVYERENNVKADKFGMNENGMVEAEFNKELDLGLEEDREGNLIEGNDTRFFKVGDGKLPLESLKWEGKVSVKAMSIISSNPELEKQVKLEMFNLIFPVLQAMLMAKTSGDIDSALAFYKPIKQVLEMQEEKPENWLPDDIVELAENPEKLAEMKKAKEKADNPLMVDQNQLAKEELDANGKPAVARTDVSNPLRKELGAIKGANTKAVRNWQR